MMYLKRYLTFRLFYFHFCAFYYLNYITNTHSHNAAHNDTAAIIATNAHRKVLYTTHAHMETPICKHA